jgi:hypothetical protein
LTQAQIDIALPISMVVIFIGLVISVAMLWKERKRNK